MIKCGRYVERLDLYLRLGFPASAIERALCKMTPRLKQSDIVYDEDILDCLHARVREEVMHVPGWRRECARQLVQLITE